jgi:aminoglycoside phosphotransferase (APT) family kinase protein
MEAYRRAMSSDGAESGYYHRNIRLVADGRPVIVRIPVSQPDAVDLSIWCEPELLAAIGPCVTHAQRLIHASRSPEFQIHEFITGDLLEDISPLGRPVSPVVLRDVVQLFSELVSIPLDQLPELPDGWPGDGDTPAFASRLSEVALAIHKQFRLGHSHLLDDLGIPPDPLIPFADRWSGLRSRPFRLVHSDIHRKNIILQQNKGRAVFIDWQLALWGDPLYDLASHVHKMAYPPNQREAVVRGWVEAVPAECSAGWEADLETYLAHERVKSAFVDAVRYTQQYSAMAAEPGSRRALIDRLARKLDAARPYLSAARRLTHAEIEDAVRNALSMTEAG